MQARQDNDYYYKIRHKHSKKLPMLTQEGR